MGEGMGGEEEIGRRVVVVIDPHYSETVIADVVVNAGFDRNFLESAVAAIVIEEIAFTFEAPRATLHQNAFEAAEFVAAELGEIVHVQMGVAGDTKIETAAAVVVAPGGAGHEAAAADSRIFRDGLELAITDALVDRAAAD